MDEQINNELLKKENFYTFKQVYYNWKDNEKSGRTWKEWITFMKKNYELNNKNLKKIKNYKLKK